MRRTKVEQTAQKFIMKVRIRAVDIFNQQTLVAKLVPDGVVGTYECVFTYSHAGKNIDKNIQFISIVLVPLSKLQEVECDETNRRQYIIILGFTKGFVDRTVHAVDVRRALYKKSEHRMQGV